MSLWPDLHYGDVDNYLIESKGQYTSKHLSHWKLSITFIMAMLEQCTVIRLEDT